MNNFEPNQSSCPPCPSDESIFFNLILGARYENTKENCLIFLNNYSKQIFYSKREIFKILIKELTIGEYSNKEIGKDESIYLIRQLIKKYSRNNIINALYEFVSEKVNINEQKIEDSKNYNNLVSHKELINKKEYNKNGDGSKLDIEKININKKKESNNKNKNKEKCEKEESNENSNKNKFLSKKRRVLNSQKNARSPKLPIKGKSTKSIKNSSKKKKENKNAESPIEKYLNLTNTKINSKNKGLNSINKSEKNEKEKNVEEKKDEEEEKSFHIEKINKNIKAVTSIIQKEEKVIDIENEKEEEQIPETKEKKENNDVHEKSEKNIEIKEDKKEENEEDEKIKEHIEENKKQKNKEDIENKNDNEYKEDNKEKEDKDEKNDKEEEKEITEDEDNKKDEEDIQIQDEIKDRINNLPINKSKSYKQINPDITNNEKSSGHKTKVNPKRIFNVDEVVKLESSGEIVLNNSLSVSSINSVKSLKKKTDNNNGSSSPDYNTFSQIFNSSEEPNENEFRSHLIKISKNSDMVYSYKIRKYGGPNNSILFFECNNKKCLGKGQYDTVTKIFTETEKHSLPFNVHKLASMYINAKDTLLNDNECNGYQLLKDYSFIKDKKVDFIK